MKKFLCLILAVVSVACFSGCFTVDSTNGKCDECGNKSGGAWGYPIIYVNDDGKIVKKGEGHELCAKCADNIYKVYGGNLK